MEEIIGAVLGIIFAAAAIAAVLLFARAVRKEKTHGDTEYDERQLMLREKGYRLGFFVTLIAEALVLLLLEYDVIPAASATMAVYTALIAGVAVFAVFCAMQDVFFPMGEKGTTSLVLWAGLALVNGLSAGIRIANGTMVRNGAIRFSDGSYIVNAALFLTILAACLIRRFVKEREE